MPGCSWRGHLRGVHIYYCPGVLAGDTCEGYIFITARVFLEGTPAMGTYGFHYYPGVLGGDTYDGYIMHLFHELRVIEERMMMTSLRLSLDSRYGKPKNEMIWTNNRMGFKVKEVKQLVNKIWKQGIEELNCT
ncbi:hypothetical protein Tco_0500411 [Tanacetum coccineum]